MTERAISMFAFLVKSKTIKKKPTDVLCLLKESSLNSDCVHSNISFDTYKLCSTEKLTSQRAESFI